MSKIIAFIEDPGAANFFLNKNNSLFNDIDLYSVDPAFTYLKARKVKSNHLNDTDILNNINTNKTQLLLTGTSENKCSLAFKLIELCRKHHIQTFSVIDSPAALDKRFKGMKTNNFYYLTDYQLNLQL